MAEECSRRSESRCMTPFSLNPIAYTTNLKPFEYRQNKGPHRLCGPFTR